MKLFQQLLVAPAALGLMAPVAATASELNINDVSSYSDSGVATQSISNFSDVHPTDWAYQALNSMRKRVGCTAASPNGSMTRYEAAALLNKCLENVSQANEEEQTLIEEFSAELAVIRGRLDVLEEDLAGVEAGVFSTTTKLSGATTFVVGGISTETTPAVENQESVVFNYDTKISLESSFTGDDLLVQRLRVGNFDGQNNNDPFASGDTTLEVASSTTNSDDWTDSVTLDRSYYQFPIGDEGFTATIGAVVRQDDMLGVWPSAYPGDAVLDVLTYAGANAAYNLAVGPGAGITWANDQFSATALFVSQDGMDASSQENRQDGLLTAHGRDTVTGQLAWLGDNFTLAGVVTVDDNGNWNDSVDAGDYTAYGISGVYEFDAESQWIPASISAGAGWKSVDNHDNPDTRDNDIEDTQTWTIGAIWEDAFIDGNNLGFAIGTADSANLGHKDDDGYDNPLAYEFYYQMTVSDNVTVTPALFVVQRDGTLNDDEVGALVKTTFTF